MGNKQPACRSVTLFVFDDLLTRAQKVAQERGLNLTDLFDRALRHELFLHEAQRRGHAVLLEDQDGVMGKVFFCED